MYTYTYIYKIYNYDDGKKKQWDGVNYTQGACTQRPGLCRDLSVCKTARVWRTTKRHFFTTNN